MFFKVVIHYIVTVDTDMKGYCTLAMKLHHSVKRETNFDNLSEEGFLIAMEWHGKGLCDTVYGTTNDRQPHLQDPLTINNKQPKDLYEFAQENIHGI
jgi:hypothetical protein